MIIFNHDEYALHYLQRDRRNQPLDQTVIEINTLASEIPTPEALLQRLKDGENLADMVQNGLVHISAYKTGDGKYTTQAQYLVSDNEFEDVTEDTAHILTDEEMDNQEHMRHEEDRADLAKAYESYIFNNPWRHMQFTEMPEITEEIIIDELSLAVGIMPTLENTDEKSVKELLAISAVGDKLYRNFELISAHNKLPSQRDIEFYTSLNEYEKRIISMSGVHPALLLELAEELKKSGKNILLTAYAENMMHFDGMTPAAAAAIINTPAREEDKKQLYTGLNGSRIAAKDIPFALYTAPSKSLTTSIDVLLLLHNRQMETFLSQEHRGTIASRTHAMLGSSGYLKTQSSAEISYGVPMLSDIYSIYNSALSDIQTGKFSFNPEHLNNWRDELCFEDFCMAMWNERAAIDIPEVLKADFDVNKIYKDTVKKYRQIYTEEFLPKFPDGYETSQVKEFAKKKKSNPVSKVIKKAEEIARETFNGFVPRVLAEYVYAHLDSEHLKEPTEEQLRNIVTAFNRTSIQQIAKYKSPSLFVLSDKLNFAEIRQEHIDVFATQLTAAQAGTLIQNGFIEWYKAHKNTNTSDLTGLFNHINQIDYFDAGKTAEDIVDDILNARGKAECRLMENRYSYSFADNELAIRGRHVVAIDGRMKMYMLSAKDYRNFTVGYDTHCCQHHNGAGESCVWKATADPFAGVVVIEREGAILGQAFVWTDEARDTFVFDNMEFANDREVSSFTALIAEYCAAMPYSNIHMGMGYNSLGSGFGKEIKESEEAKVPTTITRNPLRNRDGCVDDGVDIYTDYHVSRSYGNKARVLKRNGDVYLIRRPGIRVTSAPDESTRWDIMMRPENAIWLNDCSTSVEERIRFAQEFLNNPSPEVQMKAVRKNLDAIQYIDNPTAEVQEYVIQRDANKAILIANPCERVQEILLARDCAYIRQIQHPTEAMAIQALQQNGLLIEAIPENVRTEAVISAAVRQNGYAIQYIARPSEAVQILAVNSTPKVISMIPCASESVQEAAVRNNPSVLTLINNPSEHIQCVAAENAPYVITRLKNPAPDAVRIAVQQEGTIIRNYQYQYPELRMVAIRANPYALRELKDPTLEECVAAVRQNPAVKRLIQNVELYNAVENIINEEHNFTQEQTQTEIDYE